MKWAPKRDKPLTDSERSAIFAALLKNLRELETEKKFSFKRATWHLCKTLVIDGYELDVKLDQEHRHIGLGVHYGRPYLKFGGYMHGRTAHRAICGNRGFDWPKVVQLCMTEARIRRQHEEAKDKAERARQSGERKLEAIFKRLPAAEGSIHGVEVESDGSFTVTARGLNHKLVEELLERLLAAEMGGELTL